MDIKNLRKNYNLGSIDFTDINSNPIAFFSHWFKEALEKEDREVNAFVLSTVNIDNIPSSRVVLLKNIEEKGFVFFTNYNSSKAKDIEINKHVSMNFYWPKLERQVRIVGFAKKISEQESNNYFKNRPRESQIGAVISSQSKEIDLDFNFQELIDKFNHQDTIKKPVHWGGFFVSPIKIEFWQGKPSRLHDRLAYELIDGNWIYKRISP